MGITVGVLEHHRYLRRGPRRTGRRGGARPLTGHSDRFGLLATLPLPDIEAALAEIEHSFDELHADGIGLHTTGAFTRFPDIRWVVPHSGAALAVLADRVDRIYPATRAADTRPTLTSSARCVACTSTSLAYRCHARRPRCSLSSTPTGSSTAVTTP